MEAPCHPLPTDEIVKVMKDYISALHKTLPSANNVTLAEKVARVREEFEAMKASDAAVNDPNRTVAQINRFLGESFSFLCLQECDQDT